MILTLFCVFLVLSIVLIGLGLKYSDHTELSLIGFLFLFLLSLTILNEGVVYNSGENVSSTFDYSIVNGSHLLTSSEEAYTKTYSPIVFDGGITSHLVGYWLAVASILGFIGVILGLRKSKGYK